MAAAVSTVEIRSPRSVLWFAALIGLNGSFQMFEPDRWAWNRAIAAFLLAAAVLTLIGYLVNHVSVTSDAVLVRSFLVTREYKSSDAVRAFDDGRRLYVDDRRLKLPFPVPATMMTEAVMRARGHLPRDIGKQPFGSGRFVDDAASAMSSESTIADIATKSAPTD